MTTENADTFPSTDTFSGRYFDGKSARATPVQVTITTLGSEPYLIAVNLAEASNSLDDPRAHVRQTLVKKPLRDVVVNDPKISASARFDLGENALIEIPDQARVWRSLEQHGFSQSLVQKSQSSWSWAIGAVVAVFFVGFLTFKYALPWGAEQVTAALPASVEKMVGDQAWPELERSFFKPSKLSPERQAELANGFAAIVAKLPDAPQYELLFRSFMYGPNALALPGGRIVLTDELVALSKDDNALYGVLLHELAHVKFRHSMRNMVQSAGITALISVWFGDVSSIITVIPTALATSNYSRAAETEADLFALNSMIAAGVPTKPIAALFVAMMGKSNDKDSKLQRLLSSHPVTADRVKLFENK